MQGKIISYLKNYFKIIIDLKIFSFNLKQAAEQQCPHRHPPIHRTLKTKAYRIKFLTNNQSKQEYSLFFIIFIIIIDKTNKREATKFENRIKRIWLFCISFIKRKKTKKEVFYIVIP